MVKVVGVKPRNKGSMVKLEREEDGAKIEVWCSAEKLVVESWNGTPPPEFELRKKRDSEELILVEKQGRGGGGGYRQSKEAFEREAASRAAWQRFEEERKDRRTALMTVYERARGLEVKISDLLQEAEEAYDWLRETSGEVWRPPVTSGGGQGERRVESPGTAGSPGRELPPDRSGEGTAAEPERATASPSPEHPSATEVGPPPRGRATYPVDPANCDHRKTSGDWVRWVEDDGVERCPKCGTDRLSAVEGTAADLGPAR
ncbi:MAG TPA: hypothetical protein VFT76_00130 [Actinomycetota bacterium]|nr:hypothetical protein [Actinomycetota bacterium]